MELQWRHNGRDSVSNQQPHDCLLNRLFRCRSKKTSKLRVTGLCSPVLSEFPAQMASNTENVSIWWRHQVLCYWNSELIIKAKLKLESGNQKIQYSCQVATLKMTSLKITRFLSMAMIDMHMWNLNSKAILTYAPETFIYRRTDGQGESSISPPTSLGGAIKWPPIQW